MPHRNNLIVVTVFIAAVFLAAIPLDWLTTTTGSSVLTVTGRTGHLAFAGVASLPIWLLLCVSAAVTVVAGLNAIRATTVPFLLLAALLVAGGAYYVLPFFSRDDPTEHLSFSVGAGDYLALVATFAATLLTLIRPLPAPLSRPNHALQRTEAGHRVHRAGRA